MSTLTIAQLIAAGISPTVARAFVEPLCAAFDDFNIDTPVRMAAFIGQCSFESNGFRDLEESLYYSHVEHIRAVFPNEVASLVAALPLVGHPELLANTVYANRNGNGDFASGDGWIFRGRGLIDITGRDKYAAAATFLQLPYIDFPDLVSQPAGAVRSACWYWMANHLNALADTGSCESVTHAINPAMMGIDGRRMLTARALTAVTT